MAENNTSAEYNSDENSVLRAVIMKIQEMMRQQDQILILTSDIEACAVRSNDFSSDKTLGMKRMIMGLLLSMMLLLLQMQKFLTGQLILLT